ncbi:hypothetical protein GJ496_006105 [Pomphorhynchus laevis]|nr:hypothetical protein GJ496_006105 [Pomphorhynchus laevis]
MAPPTDEQIQNIVNKQYGLEQIKNILGDYVKEEDQDMICGFLLGAPVNIDQVRAVIYGKYEIKKIDKGDGTGYSISINFDLTGVAPHKLDSKLPPNIMDLIIDKEHKEDKARKRRILSGLIPDKDLDLVLQEIGNGKLNACALDAVINGHYKVVDGKIKILQQLDIADPLLNIDNQLIEKMLSGEYTFNQLAGLLKYKFSPVEIKAVFDSGLSDMQLKGLIKGNYEISRAALDDGSGYVITLVYSKDGYKKYLQSILERKYPVEKVLKLFDGRLGPEELEALLSMNISIPTLHALIIGDYIIQRIDNPDGSYHLDLVYNKGAGKIKEIIEIEDDVKDIAHSEADDKTSGPETKDNEAGKKPLTSKKATKAEPIVAPGEVKKRLLKAEEAVKSSLKPTVSKELEQPIQNVHVPNFEQDKAWSIDKGSKLKIPAIFSSAVKPNFFKKEVKHLESDKLKSFYQTKAQKHK